MKSWAVFFISISAGLIVSCVWLPGGGARPVESACEVASGLACAWSMMAMADRGTRRSFRRAAIAAAARFSSIWCGVLCGVVLVYLLVIRAVEALLEVGHGAPLATWTAPGFGWHGLRSIGKLAAACAIGLLTARDRRVIAPLMWLTAMGVLWTAAALPTFVVHADGTYARTPGVLIAIVGLSLIVGGFTRGQWLARAGGRRRAAMEGGAATEQEHEWPGLRQSAGALGVLLVLLIGLQTAVPPDRGWVSPRWAAVMTAVAALLAGTACFHTTAWRWSANLADLAMGLVTLAAGSAAVALLPADAGGLDAQFPLVFNAWMIALGLMSGMWG
ncbi:MAG: hypothetical protein HOP29_15980, partial [Phycisphaerales bacterium]|nr:hypothetical protein [Phycisphaerales bacterium]